MLIKVTFFHLEATENTRTLIKDIWGNGIKFSLSIKVGNTVEYLAPGVNQIDMALAKTVEPGFGGQTLLYDTTPKGSLRIQYQHSI